MVNKLAILGLDRYDAFVRIYVKGGSYDLPHEWVPSDLNEETKGRYILLETVTVTQGGRFEGYSNIEIVLR